MKELEADYVIVGAGCAAMAFADTLLSETSASLLMVDRRHAPGGHWNDAYPFVRLHGPALFYGVNSRRLGSETVERAGPNRGLLELSSGAEICAYFDRLMRERFLAGGRVRYLPLSDYGAGGTVVSRLDGSRTRVRARTKLVDATYADTRLPTTHPPAFEVAPDVLLAPPHALTRPARPVDGWTILGAGKTAMDAVVWLIEQGADPGRITWIRPRDQWLLPREKMQPHDAFFASTIGGFAAEMEAASQASTIADLFARLEGADLLTRIDPAVVPAMYRCAVVSAGELELLRRVENVVRLGRVKSIEADRITLDDGVIPTSPGVLHVNCTADGIPRRPTQPIFTPDRILLQYVRRCSPSFSAAFLAHVEATYGSDEEKNALCRPVPAPDEPLDWLRQHLHEARNRAVWGERPDLQSWLLASRLDRFSGMIARALEAPTPAAQQVLDRYRRAMKPGLSRLEQLLAARAEQPHPTVASSPLADAYTPA